MCAACWSRDIVLVLILSYSQDRSQRGTSQEVIAQLIDVSKSTVSREVKRNSTKNGKYVWFKAHNKAEERKKRTPGNRNQSPSLAMAHRTAHKGGTVVSAPDKRIHPQRRCEGVSRNKIRNDESC